MLHSRPNLLSWREGLVSRNRRPIKHRGERKKFGQFAVSTLWRPAKTYRALKIEVDDINFANPVVQGLRRHEREPHPRLDQRENAIILISSVDRMRLYSMHRKQLRRLHIGLAACLNDEGLPMQLIEPDQAKLGKRMIGRHDETILFAKHNVRGELRRLFVHARDNDSHSSAAQCLL